MAVAVFFFFGSGRAGERERGARERDADDDEKGDPKTRTSVAALAQQVAHDQSGQRLIVHEQHVDVARGQERVGRVRLGRVLAVAVAGGGGGEARPTDGLVLELLASSPSSSCPWRAALARRHQKRARARASE